MEKLAYLSLNKLFKALIYQHLPPLQAESLLLEQELSDLLHQEDLQQGTRQ